MLPLRSSLLLLSHQSFDLLLQFRHSPHSLPLQSDRRYHIRSLLPYTFLPLLDRSSVCTFHLLPSRNYSAYSPLMFHPGLLHGILPLPLLQLPSHRHWSSSWSQAWSALMYMHYWMLPLRSSLLLLPLQPFCPLLQFRHWPHSLPLQSDLRYHIRSLLPYTFLPAPDRSSAYTFPLLHSRKHLAYIPLMFHPGLLPGILSLPLLHHPSPRH